MIFTEAVRSVFAESKTIAFRPTDAELDGCDAIVFAAANWINEKVDLGHVADRLEQIDLPVFLVGVGAQSGVEKKIPKIPKGTEKLLKTIAERSVTISTRGVFSCEVLEAYGITNTRPTGCPSMLLMRDQTAADQRPASLERVTMHGTAHQFGVPNEDQKMVYRSAFQSGSDLLLQSEFGAIMVSSGESMDDSLKLRVENNLCKTFGHGDADELAKYLRSSGKVFWNFSVWIEYLKGRTFCLGTRIHGTISSLIAGTPALLIAHDSRTNEMADIMGIPKVEFAAVASDGRLDLDKALEQWALGHDVVEIRRRYFSEFAAFFEENGLDLRAEALLG